MSQHPPPIRPDVCPHQRGLTLVELLVAMTVGLFLTGGIISLFLAAKQSYRSNEALAIVQENGRYQLERLATDLRQSGSFGCQRIQWLKDKENINNILALPDDNSPPNTDTEKLYLWLYDYADKYQPAIEAFEGTGNGFATGRELPGDISISTLFGTGMLSLSEAIDDHDVIVTRGVQGAGIWIIQHDSPSDPLIVSMSDLGETNIHPGDIAIASTCASNEHDNTPIVEATVFQVTDIKKNTPCTGLATIEHEVTTQCGSNQCPEPINNSADLELTFANPLQPEENPDCPSVTDNAIGMLYTAQTGIYYIRKNPDGVPAMYFKKNLSNSEQIITGIYGFEALFGFNDQGEPPPDLTEYRQAKDIGEKEWRKINSIKLSLIVGSHEDDHANVVDAPLSFPFPNAEGRFDAGKLKAKDQKRIFQVFTSTIYLRNQLTVDP